MGVEVGVGGKRWLDAKNGRTNGEEGRGGGISREHRIREGDEGGRKERKGERALPSVFLRTRSTAPEQPPQVMVMSKW